MWLAIIIFISGANGTYQMEPIKWRTKADCIDFIEIVKLKMPNVIKAFCKLSK